MERRGFLIPVVLGVLLFLLLSLGLSNLPVHPHAAIKHPDTWQRAVEVADDSSNCFYRCIDGRWRSICSDGGKWYIVVTTAVKDLILTAFQADDEQYARNAMDRCLGTN